MILIVGGWHAGPDYVRETEGFHSVLSFSQSSAEQRDDRDQRIHLQFSVVQKRLTWWCFRIRTYVEEGHFPPKVF